MKMMKKDKKKRPQKPIIFNMKEGALSVVSTVISPVTRNVPNFKKLTRKKNMIIKKVLMVFVIIMERKEIKLKIDIF